MVAFTAADLQRNAANLQKAAMREPVFITYHEKPRFVLLSMEDYARLGGAALQVAPEGLPESVVSRLQELANAYPHEELKLAGGLVDQMIRHP